MLLTVEPLNSGHFKLKCLSAPQVCMGSKTRALKHLAASKTPKVASGNIGD